MGQPIFIVDAFAEAPFSGNPAAVVPLQEPRSGEWMARVAAEMSLSETAFVHVGGSGDIKRLRWFTPNGEEVDLCGHATLATTHLLGGSQRFETRSGELRCHVSDDGWIEMDFPSDPIETIDLNCAELLPGTEVASTWSGQSGALVEVKDAETVRNLQPNFAAISASPFSCLIVTAESDLDGVDFVSRCFLPAIGIPEDPVTGSAHCTLGSFWSAELGKGELIGQQLSRRGGRVRVRNAGDRVWLSGHAVTVMQGELTADH